jgi:hypothetical protein
VGAGQHTRFEANALQFQHANLIEPRAFEHAVGVSGVNGKAVEAPRFGVSVKGDLFGLAQTELLDRHADRSGRCVLQAHFHFEFIGPGDFPFAVDWFSLLIGQTDFAHATSIGRLQVQSVFAADDQHARIL